MSMDERMDFMASFLDGCSGVTNVRFVTKEGRRKESHVLLLAGASPLLRSLLVEAGQQQMTTILLPSHSLQEVEECLESLLLGVTSQGGLSDDLGISPVCKVGQATEEREQIESMVKQVEHELEEKMEYKKNQGLNGNELTYYSSEKKRQREERARRYTIAVASYLKGEQSLMATAQRFGVKKTTLYDWVVNAREGKRCSIWGRESKVFTQEEEEMLREDVVKMEKKMSMSDLQKLMQDKLFNLVTANPLRVTGFESRNQEPTYSFARSYATRHSVWEKIKKGSRWNF